MSPLGSQTSFGTMNTTRIENVVDWETIAKKYRVLIAHEIEETGSMKDSDDDRSIAAIDPAAAAANAQQSNPTAALPV